MKKILILAAVLSLFNVSCAYQPHQTTQVVDDRPQLSFVWQRSSLDANSATLFVDGQSFGSVAQYLYPNSSVPLLVGEHLIEVRTSNQIIFSKEDYFGENQDYKLEVQ